MQLKCVVVGKGRGRVIRNENTNKNSECRKDLGERSSEQPSERAETNVSLPKRIAAEKRRKDRKTIVRI